MFFNELGPCRIATFEQFASTIPQGSEIKQEHCHCACAKRSSERTVTSPQAKVTLSKSIYMKEIR